MQYLLKLHWFLVSLLLVAGIMIVPPTHVSAQDSTYIPTLGLDKVKAAVSRLEREGGQVGKKTWRVLLAEGKAILAHEQQWFEGKIPLQREIKKATEKSGQLERKDRDLARRINDFNAYPGSQDEADKLNRESKELFDAIKTHNDYVEKDLNLRVDAVNKKLVERYAAFVKNAERFLGASVAHDSKWSGIWDKKEKDKVQDSLGGLKDRELRNWIDANAEFDRAKPDGVSPLSAHGSVLRFKDDFFSGTTKRDNGRRKNLIAFEAGKVFWNSMKDKPVGGGKTLELWFTGYVGGNFSVIGDMHKAKHGNEDLPTSDRLDVSSSFAHIFRAQVLELDKPKEQRAQQKWDEVIGEFRTRIDRLLRGKQ